MSTNCANGSLRLLVCLLAAAAIGATFSMSTASAAERKAKAKSGFGEFNPSDDSVDLFDGMNDGQLEVKFIPKDSSQANVLIKNKSDKPLNVKLPDAFAARPVLAQIGGGLGGGGGRLGGNMGGMGGGQMMGGGMGGMGGGMGGGMMGGMGGMGGGMFNIPPEKVGKLKVACVCLEHGKAEPRAAIPYEIKPIDSLVPNKAVQELCRMVGSGKVNQRVAQAAAWNLQNGMSWDALAAKRVEHVGGLSEPYFSEYELRGHAAGHRGDGDAEQRPKDSTKSPGETAASQSGLGSDSLVSDDTSEVAEDKTRLRRKARAR